MLTHRMHFKHSVLHVTLLFLLYSVQALAIHAPGDAKSYTIGVVPQFEQRKIFKIWRPILDELEKRTGLFLHLAGSTQISSFAAKFLAGDYDFVYMNPYHVLLSEKTQGYIPLVRDGGRQLTGILVVNRDSGIDTLAQLKKQTIAFPAPNSLGASLVIRSALINDQQLDFTPKYVQTHSSVYLHVVLGITSAGGGVMATLKSQSPEVQDKLKILYRSRPMAPHPFMAHPRVPEDDRELLKNALMEMKHNARTQGLLKKIPMLDAVEALFSDYQELASWGLDKLYVKER